MRAFQTLSILALTSMLLTSCATITRGTKEVLVVESEPVGAKVTTTIGLTGTTPATFKVSRKGGFVVTIEKEGYEAVQVQVSSQVAGAGAAGMAGNVLLGGLIGAAVDAGTGAMKELKPNPIKVTLVSVGTAKAEATETVASAETAEEPETAQDSGDTETAGDEAAAAEEDSKAGDTS